MPLRFRRLIPAAASVAAFSAAAFASAAYAQTSTVVLPSDYAAAEGSTREYFTFEQTSSTYQIIVDPAQVGINVGASITGIAFRLDTTGTSVPTTTITNFDVYIGQEAAAINATTSTSFSTTFGSNVNSSTNQLVRSGSLSISNTGYAGTSPKPFGPAITFTNPFTYLGGGLVITISQSGSSATFAPYLDATAPTSGIGYVVKDANFGGGSYYGSSFSAISTQTGSRNASTTNYGVPVFQLTTTAAPEPSAVALALAGTVPAAIAAARRRRAAAQRSS